MEAVKLESHRHPLNRRELSESRVCGLCGEEVTNGSAYSCSQCNFTAHLYCAENPPPLVMEKSKIHEHALTLLPRGDVSFTCNACGLCGDKSPYVCLKCCFMIHGDCIDFPRVIKISRHNHRLSHTWYLGPREWNCGVCRKKIDGKYGGYNCTKGCLYAVHLRCALRPDVWEGVELEGVPEKDNDDLFRIEGFSVQHFSHPQHFLRLEEDKDNKDVVCSGCSLPFTSDSFYRCEEECDFFLHKTCANRPRMIHYFLHIHPLRLSTQSSSRLSRCNACDLLFNGFSYRCLKCGDVEFDLRCTSVSEPFDYHFHPHPLFLVTRRSICSVCDHKRRVLSCIKCDFTLCFACATLPDKANYKYDDHLLSYAINEEDDDTTNPDWCDVCENKIDGKKHHHHYQCSDCGPVLHTDCALGSFRNMRPGFSFTTSHGQKYEMRLLNEWFSRLRSSHREKNQRKVRRSEKGE